MCVCEKLNVFKLKSQCRQENHNNLLLKFILLKMNNFRFFWVF
jgi:hypothetical protein